MGPRRPARPRRVLAVHTVSVAPARRVALRTLARVRRDRAFSGPVLARELSSAGLAPRDVALATRLVYGTLACEGVLDEALARHLRSSVEPRVRDALRLAAYELLFTRAPAYATVDQAVEAVRQIRPQAASLANAVLRRLAADAPDFPWGDPDTDDDALARATGHPRWIVDLFVSTLGRARASEALAADLEPAPTYVRLDPFVADATETLAALAAAGAGPHPSPPDPECVILDHPALAFSKRLRGFFPMDAAAQVAPLVCGPLPDEAVLDLCAGRGNKTVCLQASAVRAGGPARITAVELHPGRARMLESRLAASNVPRVAVVVADATREPIARWQGRFDAVLVDAPCTGLGTLRRYPEKRWRLLPSQLDELVRLQSALLAAAATAVRPGGRVVYSTCSITSRENTGVVREFLDGPDGGAFALEPVTPFIPDECWSGFVDADGCFQSWPTQGGPDGHFVSLLRRRTS